MRAFPVVFGIIECKIDISGVYLIGQELLISCRSRILRILTVLTRRSGIAGLLILISAIRRCLSAFLTTIWLLRCRLRI